MKSFFFRGSVSCWFPRGVPLVLYGNFSSICLLAGRVAFFWLLGHASVMGFVGREK